MFGVRAPPGPAGEAYVLHKPQAGFLEKEGRGEKREKGDKKYIKAVFRFARWRRSSI